jgi:membrane protein implicated in regulation of membrane protease activity
MRWIASIVHEVFGLFVDDGLFALAIILWLAVAALMLPLVPLPLAWHGPVLFAGLAVILSWNCLRHLPRRSI